MSSKARLEIAGMLQTYSPRGHPKNPWMRGEVGVGYFFVFFRAKSWVISKWLNSWDDHSWRIIPFSKWLGSPIYKPWSSAIWKGSHIALLKGDLPTVVISHLQVMGKSSKFSLSQTVRANGQLSVVRWFRHQVFWHFGVIQLFGPPHFLVNRNATLIH